MHSIVSHLSKLNTAYNPSRPQYHYQYNVLAKKKVALARGSSCLVGRDAILI